MGKHLWPCTACPVALETKDEIERHWYREHRYDIEGYYKREGDS